MASAYVSAVQRAAKLYAAQTRVWTYAEVAPATWAEGILSAADAAVVRRVARGQLALDLSDTPDYVQAAGSSAVKHMRAYENAAMPPAPFLWVFSPPGMGKTTLACSHLAVVDIDYGCWRRLFGQGKEALDPKAYAQQLVDFMDDAAVRVASIRKAHDMLSTYVLCNEVDILHFVRELGHEAVVVLPEPGFIPDWLNGMTTRDERRYGDSGPDSFSARARQRHQKWLSDWEATAEVCHVPILRRGTWLGKDIFESFSCEGSRPRPKGMDSQEGAD